MGSWHDMNGTDYVWMFGMMALWTAVIGGAIWGAIVLLRRDSRPGDGPSAREELDRRLARGEIKEDEYTRRRELIDAAR